MQIRCKRILQGRCLNCQKHRFDCIFRSTSGILLGEVTHFTYHAEHQIPSNKPSLHNQKHTDANATIPLLAGHLNQSSAVHNVNPLDSNMSSNGIQSTWYSPSSWISSSPHNQAYTDARSIRGPGAIIPPPAKNLVVDNVIRIQSGHPSSPSFLMCSLPKLSTDGIDRDMLNRLERRSIECLKEDLLD